MPLFWKEAPEPCTGSLVFRVGRADETFRNVGITHLVEHLALHGFAQSRFDYDGTVEITVTAFSASGSPGEVVGYLNGVAAALSDLPLDRLELEKQVLVTEAAGMPDASGWRLLSLLVGPAAYGLTAEPERGLGWLTGADLTAWARQCFTKGNAAAWLTFEPPSELEPLALPEGARLPPPALEPIPSLALPSQLDIFEGGVAAGFVGKRTPALHSAFTIAVERARARLRHETGLSYSPGGSSLLLDGHHFHDVLTADCLDKDGTRVRDELLSLLDSLAEDGPTEEELEWDRDMHERALRRPDWPFAELDFTARDELFGVEPRYKAERVRERAELTRASVAQALADALETLIVLVPDGVPLAGRRTLHDYEPDNRDVLEGRTYRPADQWREWGFTDELVVGEAGVSASDATGDGRVTIPFADCVAGIRQLSGRLILVARTGSRITINPQHYEDGSEVLHPIEAALGEERIVPLGGTALELEPLVRAQLMDRPALIAEEVDKLPEVLTATEEVHALAEARSDGFGETGLLAITDQRLLFVLCLDETWQFERPLAEISHVAVKGLFSKELVVTFEDSPETLRVVAPKERLTEMAELLRA